MLSLLASPPTPIYAKFCPIRYINVLAPSATAPKLPYTQADPIDLNSAPYRIDASAISLPLLPCVAYNPLLAKYVKLLSHSTLTPLVIVIQSTPGVMNVTL